MSFQTEFPDFPAADLPAIPAGFEDTSWHNDACPSFINEALGLRIWVDYADEAQREMPDGPRFILEPHMDDKITDPTCSDDWTVIVAAIDEEREEIAVCLDQLAKADGAILYWQLDDRKFTAMHQRGLIRMEGDCFVHPRARKISDLAFTMAKEI